MGWRRRNIHSCFQAGSNDNDADYMKFFSGNYAAVSAQPTLIIEYYIP
jgi:hypothetical protein